MKAADLAAELMKHPDADVMALSPDDDGYDFLAGVKYIEDSDRFYLLW